MRRIPVVSSNLVSVGYDPQSMTLEIEFQGGAVYQYFDVPESVYNELLGAPSVGKFFAAQVKGVYRFARV